MKITNSQPSGIAGIMAGHSPAGGVTVVDSGGYYTGADLEAILAEIGAGLSPGAFLTVIGGGKGTVQDLGSVTGTATVDFANANAFLMELAGNTTVGTTGWTNLKDVQVRLAIDGSAGGFTATISGVTWVTSAPGVIGAGETLHVVLWGNDGGTTIWGAVVGAGGITIKDEGSSLATAATSIDFVGAGVVASGTGAAKTVTIAGLTAATLAAAGVVGPILIADDHSTPIVFADLLLTEDGSDLLYADVG